MNWKKFRAIILSCFLAFLIIGLNSETLSAEEEEVSPPHEAVNFPMDEDLTLPSILSSHKIIKSPTSAELSTWLKDSKASPVTPFEFPSIQKLGLDTFKPPSDRTGVSAPKVSVTSPDYTSALSAGAYRLVGLQADITEDNAGNGDPDVDLEDGGWDWQVDSTITAHSGSPSPTNTYGVTAGGVLGAYIALGGKPFPPDHSVLTSLEDAYAGMLADTTIDSGGDFQFLVRLSEKTGDSKYADLAKARYDAKKTLLGGSKAWADSIFAWRAGLQNGIIPFDINLLAVGAAKLNDYFPGQGYDFDADTFAQAIYDDIYNDTPGYFDETDKTEWWWTLGIAGALEAFTVSGTHPTERDELADTLLNYQNDGITKTPKGAWDWNDTYTGGDYQTTAYAIMALMTYGGTQAESACIEGVNWLVSEQRANGGWYWDGGNECTEEVGEVLWAISLVVPTEVWVDDDFNSSTPGWSYDHFDKIQDGVDAVAAGGTVHVADGNYDATTSPFVRITKPLTLLGESRDGVILDGTGTSTISWAKGIHVTADSVTIKNLTVQNFGAPGYWGYGVLFRDYAHDTPGEGYIFYYGCVAENVKSQNNCYPMYALVNRNLTVRNCLIQDNLGDGMFIARECDNVIITENTVLNSGDHGIWVGKCWTGLGPSDTATITDNFIDGAREGGITFCASDSAFISGNAITNVKGEEPPAGWSVGALSLKDGVSNVTVSNNYIHGNDGLGTGCGRGVGVDGTSSNITIFDNIISDNAGEGIKVIGSTSVWSCNSNYICCNTGYGAENTTGTTLDFENNWWGASDGPSGVGPGSGDSVSTNVDYDPWMTVSVVWVDDDWAGTTCGDSVGGHLFGYDAFATIQDGIDAEAVGGVVYVHLGNYTEQLIIQKGITLEGMTSSPKPKIIAPAVRAPAFQIAESGRWWDPVIFMGLKAGAGTANITVKGFEIDGLNLGTAGNTFVAILARNANPGLIRDCDIHDFHNTFNSDMGSGIMIYGNSNVAVKNNGVSAFSKNGITANGDFGPSVDPTVTIDSNTVIGDGYITTVAQNGIQVGFGAGGVVHANTISDIGWIWDGTGTHWVSSGILPAVYNNYYAPGPVVHCTDNIITDVQCGIYYSDGNGNAIGNSYTMTNSDGLDAGDPAYAYYVGILGCDPVEGAPIPKVSPFEDQGTGEGVGPPPLRKPAAILTYDFSNNILIGDSKNTSEGIYFYNWSGGAHTLVGTATNNTVKYFSWGLSSDSDGSTVNVTFNDNTVACNTVLGIYIGGGTTASLLYNNSLFGNAQNAQDDGTPPNAWDDGSVGNFWDDWASNSGYPTIYNVPGTAGSVDNYPQAPSVVWVDDDWAGTACGDSVGGHLFGYDAFATIQDGIDAVADAGIVKVLEGTYNPFIVDAKSVTVEGQSDVIVTGNQTVTTAYGDRSTIIFVKSSTDVTLKNLNVQGPVSGTPRYGIIFQGVTGEFIQGTVSPNNVDEWSNGCGIGIWGTSDVDIKESTVRNFGKVGIFYYAASGQILDCTVEGVVFNDSLRLTNAIEPDYGSSVDIINTEVYNSRNLHPNPAWASIGILSYGWGVPTTVNVYDCNIHDNDYGIWTALGSAANSHFNFNDILGNYQYGFYNAEGVLADANLNYWGDYSGPTLPGDGDLRGTSVLALASPMVLEKGLKSGSVTPINSSQTEGDVTLSKTSGVLGTGDAISDSVTYSPWLGYPVGTVPMTYHVDTTGKIQLAIDTSSAGDTVKVHEGAFNENLVINQSIALLGSGQSTTTIYPDSSDIGIPNPEVGPSFRGSQMVVVEATDVLIDGFIFDGDSPTLTPPGTIDARNGIITNYNTGNWNNLTVQNCTVKNIYFRGIYASAMTANNLTGINFNHNTVDNVNGSSFESLGLMFWGASGTITHNTITNSSIGAMFHWYSDGNLDSNIASGCELGFAVNSNDQTTTLSSNTITDSDQGIQTISVDALATVSDNIITDCKEGIVLYGGGPGLTDVVNNLIDGPEAYPAIGLYASTDLGIWGMGDVFATLRKNTITGNFYGMVFNEPDTIRTQLVSITVSGSADDRNFIYDNSSFELLMEYCDNDVNATYNYWGKSLLSQIEDEIYHQVDQSDLGLVDFGNPLLHGDVNLDGEINLGDVIYLANYLLKSGPEPPIFLIADVNCDDKINLSDVIYLANYLLKGGPAPCGGALAKATVQTQKKEMEKVEIVKPASVHSLIQ